jgi:hypothetical protein
MSSSTLLAGALLLLASALVVWTVREVVGEVRRMEP